MPIQDSWNIFYYESSSGETPVQSFIDSQEKKARIKIARMFDLLEEFGVRIGAQHAKKLTGTDLWELRILGSDSIRIFYITQHPHTSLLLHAFKKKRQETPPREIKTALNRLQEYRTRKKK